MKEGFVYWEKALSVMFEWLDFDSGKRVDRPYSRRAASIIEAALGDEPIYRAGIFIEGIGAPELQELLDRGVLVQVWPEV